MTSLHGDPVLKAPVRNLPSDHAKAERCSLDASPGDFNAEASEVSDLWRNDLLFFPGPRKENFLIPLKERKLFVTEIARAHNRTCPVVVAICRGRCHACREVDAVAVPLGDLSRCHCLIHPEDDSQAAGTCFVMLHEEPSATTSAPRYPHPCRCRLDRVECCPDEHRNGHGLPDDLAERASAPALNLRC